MKRILFLITACLLLTSVYSQTMRKTFGDIPDLLSLSIDSIKRQQLMDLYSSDEKAFILDNLNDTCYLSQFSDTYICLKQGIKTTEIALLPMINDSKVICMITTICAPLCDSRLDFYTTNWKKLEREAFIQLVDYTAFFKQTENTDMSDIRKQLDIDLMQFSIIPEKNQLIQTYNTPLFLSIETKRLIEPLLINKPVVYIWDKTHFRKENH